MRIDNSDIVFSIGVSIGILAMYYIVFFILKRWAGSQKRVIPSLMQDYLHGPGLFLCCVIIADLLVRRFEPNLHQSLFDILVHALNICIICAVGFLLIRVVNLLTDIIIYHYQRRNSKDYSLRSARTKFTLIQRIVNFLIIVVTLALVLLSFSEIRKVGTTLLASAGVAGVVLGFAAQKSLGTLLAGIQIALAQPIKIDDVVVIEGVYGTVGEITLTYVVINTWDEKRLIVPITYFMEKVIENWTRESPEMLASVKITTGFDVPVDSLRKEFMKWLETSPKWDKRKAALLVTATSDKTVELRATMSAANSDDAFLLETEIREKFITHIREKYPEAFGITKN